MKCITCRVSMMKQNLKKKGEIDLFCTHDKWGKDKPAVFTQCNIEEIETAGAPSYCPLYKPVE